MNLRAGQSGCGYSGWGRWLLSSGAKLVFMAGKIAGYQAPIDHNMECDKLFNFQFNINIVVLPVGVVTGDLHE